MIMSLLISMITPMVDMSEAEHEGLEINGIYHDVETLLKNLDRPYFMEVDHSSDDLYFCHGTDADRRPARLNMVTREFYDIPGINPGRTGAQAINQEGPEFYVGGAGENAIYKYDHRNNVIKPIATVNKVWKLYYNNDLYFTDYPAYKLHVINKDGEAILFEDLKDTTVVSFVIDDDNVMFYNNASGLYMRNRGSTDSVLLWKSRTIFDVRSLSFNAYGDLYVVVEDGVYLVNKMTRKLQRVLHTDGLGVTFDRHNNMIFTSWDTIYRLKPCAGFD